MNQMFKWLPLAGALFLIGCTYTAPGSLECTDGETDGNRVCVGGVWVSADSDMCTPKTCAEVDAECGPLEDGCGNTITCGSCPEGQQCGTETPNVCGDVCEPATCASASAECGMLDPGCNADMLDCGTCTSPETCGSVTDNQCDCVPDTCAGLMSNCGVLEDGCGGTLNCGMCTAPETCGGGGTEFTCGCAPTLTCQTQGIACGMFTNDCGNPTMCDSGCFEAISAGEKHTCAVNSAGAVLCWGDNSNGQLGDGTRTDRDTPTQVTGLTTGWADVAVGASHSCALSDAGAVQCWGSNLDAQLAMDPAGTSQSLVPATVGVTGVTALSSGTNSICVVEGANTLKCWGDNSFVQLGISGDPVIAPTEVTVTATAITSLDVGRVHSCALFDNKAFCWGTNNFGQIGAGNAVPTHPTPTPVVGNADYVSVAVGLYHTCAASTLGVVSCWGAASYNGGNDGVTSQASPLGKAGAAASTGLTSAFTSTASLTAAGLEAWGRNDFGQLGDNTKTDRFTPGAVTVPGGATVVKISMGQEHGCFLSDANEAYCWGRNASNQLGLSNGGAETLVPTKVVP